MAKFNQNSLKQKKYRAVLNKFNREQGTYGNHDGKDASHGKDGKLKMRKAGSNRGDKKDGGRKPGAPHDYPKKRKPPNGR